MERAGYSTETLNGENICEIKEEVEIDELIAGLYLATFKVENN